MPVSFKRKELQELLPQYNLIEDCVAGDIAVKSRNTIYLPNPTPDAGVSSARYMQYQTRAQFYNVTKRTLAGLVGQIYLREPVVEVPTLLDPVHWDATGGGVSLEQLSKEACRKTLSLGRCGIFVDYPRTDNPASREDVTNGNIRPTITIVPARDIINWRVRRIGAHEHLSLVVMREDYIIEDDGFMQETLTQWRALRVVDGVYIQEIWRDETKSPYETIMPLDAKGSPLEYIPFMFIGSSNNDSSPDSPPLYDLASLNIGHYRNSADYEESCFIVGQPTPFVSGIDREWIQDVFKGEILLGSRAAIPLPVGGVAGLLQASPNSMPFEAMQHKERQMVSLGAKLIEQKKIQRTATEAAQDHSTELSTLASVAQNVGSAFTTALEWCAAFVGVPDTGIRFELNSEFDLTQMSAGERAQLIAEWQSGAIAWEEMRENLRRGGIATLDDAVAKEKIDAELAQAPKIEAPDDA